VLDLSKTLPIFNAVDFNFQDTRRGQNADSPASHLHIYLNDDNLPSSQSSTLNLFQLEGGGTQTVSSSANPFDLILCFGF